MLSVFPDVIYIGVAFAPFVVRISVAIAIGSLALYHLNKRSQGEKFVTEIAPWLKQHASIIATVGPTISLGIAALLFIGLLTQLAAIGAAILSLKIIYFKKKFPRIAPESRNFYVLLLVLSTLLIFAGAGPFAFDIPL